jgi:hypothetical protein
MPQAPQTPMAPMVMQPVAPQGFSSHPGAPGPSFPVGPPSFQGDATIPNAPPSKLPWVLAAVLGVALLVAVSVLWHWHTQTAHEGAAQDHPGVTR